MPLVDWTPEFSVGSATMDGHHQKLFDIINRLYDASKSQAGEAAMARIIAELIDYTHYHFRAEEQMLAKVGYPTLDAHKQMHAKFEGDLRSLKNTVDSGMAGLASISILNTSVRWLQDHILTVDKGYEAMAKAGGYT